MISEWGVTPPLSLHNPDGGGRDVTPQNEIWGQNQITWTEVSISGYDFRTGCNPPLLLSLHYTEGGRRVTPQNEIRGQNQITWTVVSISLHDFGMGCDPPLSWPPELALQSLTMISEWGVTPPPSLLKRINDRPFTWTSHLKSHYDFRIGLWHPPLSVKGTKGGLTLFWNHSVKFRWFTLTMILEWGVTPFWTIHGH